VNAANKITLARILLTMLFMIALFTDDSLMRYFGISSPMITFVSKGLALLFMILAAASDAVDGIVARRTRRTDLGALLDPLADKILISAAFISFVALREVFVPAWMVVIIISREFAVTGLRLMAAARGEVIPAGRLGKHKTAWQVGVIVTVLFFLFFKAAVKAFPATVPSFDGIRIDWIVQILIYVAMSVTVVLSITSAVNYIRANRRFLRES